MKHKRTYALFTFVMVLALVSMACGLAGSDPTDKPEPTRGPVATETSEPTEAPEPTDAPAPQDGIVVDTVYGFFDDYDDLVIVGLVTNYSDRAVSSIELEVEVFDVDDNSLYVDEIYADLSNLAPGETAPFSSSTWEELTDADTVTAVVIGNSTPSLERAYVDVVGVMTTIDDDGDMHVTGEMVNNTGAPVQVNSLAAAIFGPSDELVTAHEYSVLTRSLEPGESGPFRVTMDGPREGFGDGLSYDVYVDAEVDDGADIYAVTFSETDNLYYNSFGDLHIVGEITNDSAEYLNVSLIAAIYDADNNVVDAATFNMPLNSLGPDETLPYDFDFWGPVNDTEGMFDITDPTFSYSVQVDWYWTWTNDTRYVDISVSDEVIDFSFNSYSFEGNFLNDSGGTIDGAVIIILIVDDATGQVLAMGYSWSFDEMPDGGTDDYTVYIDMPEDFDDTGVSYEYIVVGELP